MNEDFHSSLRARDGGRLLGQDSPAVVFQGISRDGHGRRDLAGLVGQGGSAELEGRLNQGDELGGRG